MPAPAQWGMNAPKMQYKTKNNEQRRKTMSDFITKLSDMIDPEVMGDMVSARIPKRLRVAPTASY